MQEPAGVDEMRTVHIIKSICPACCEKKPLFRHGVLLPQIEFTPITPSRTGQFIVFLAPLSDQVQHKTDIDDPVLPVSQYEIITSTPLKRHSSRHAA